MNNKVRALLLGFLSWLIPFVVSLLFYTREGGLRISTDLFQTIMTVTGVASGIFLLSILFKKVNGNYMRVGLMTGILWLLINVVMDVLVLLPMSKMPIQTYVNEIGLEYLSILIMSWGIGAILNSKAKR